MLLSRTYSALVACVYAMLAVPAYCHESHGHMLTVEATGTTTPVLRIPDFGTTVPYTNKKLNNNPRNFQFAIVTDRTGGLRPGIFDDAVRKLNLLQPEFVMSVGDLIMGYTHDVDELNRQWKEFDGLVDALKMPFFYVPGNHDVTYPVQKELWKERVGPLYYHFVYGDVLFLALNSEDPSSGMSSEQVEYFRKVLEENKDVRWTLAFLHKPLWVASESASVWGEKQEEPAADTPNRGWMEFEKLLVGRPHTVFAGHVHRYTKYVRNDNRYITLATTGGGTALRGAQYYGEFDHVVWVTMTEEGPVLANLELRGIWDEDVRTQEVSQMVSPIIEGGVLTRPVVTQPFPFKEAVAQLRLTNNADIPLKITIDFEEHPYLQAEPRHLEMQVHPNSVELPDIKLLPRDGATSVSGTLPPLKLHWVAEYDVPSRPHIKLDGERLIEIDQVQISPLAPEPVNLDGDLSEWTTLPLVCETPPMVAGRGRWNGPADGHFRLATRHDAKHVYVAVEVHDDEFYAPPARPQQGDGIEIQLDPRGLSGEAGGFVVVTKQLLRGKGEKRKLASEVTVGASLSPPAEVGNTVSTDAVETTGGAQMVVRRTESGYVAEAAFTVEALVREQGANWSTYRLNVGVYDRDKSTRGKGEELNTLWWKPDWESPMNYPDSGTFLREGAAVAD